MPRNNTKDTWTLEGKAILKEIALLKQKPYVKAGFPQGDFEKPHKDENGKPTRLKVGEIAAIHEYGSTDGRIPSRSFVRSTFDTKKEEWLRLTEKYRAQIMAGKMDTKKALELLGQKIVADMRKMIKKRIPPPLALSTLQARLNKTGKGYASLNNPQGRSPVPLIDTGQMINSLTYKVFMPSAKSGIEDES
jgi:hypothetical protein